jgi:hypothetical protein
VHDPLILFHEGGIVDLLAAGNGFDKRLEIAPLMQKRFKRHVAASAGTFSVWNTCRREKLPANVFAGPSLWFFRERETGRRPDHQQVGLIH